MKTTLNFILPLVVWGGLLYSCNSKEPATKSPQETIRTDMVPVKSLQPEMKIVLPGELKAWEEIKIFPKVKGFVKVVKVDRGSFVSKGQVIAVLEAPEVIAELSEAKAKLYGARSELEEYKARFAASKGVYRRIAEAFLVPGAVSPNDVDQAKAKMLVDSSNFLSAKEQVNAAESHYHAKSEMAHYLTVTAPFSGIITERNVAAGALVGPDEASMIKPMFVLENSTKLRLTVAIPEVYTSEMPANCTASFKVNAWPNRTFRAPISRTSMSLEQGIRSMFVEFDIENKDHVLKKGMYTDVEIPIKRDKPTFFVPRTAIVSSMEKTFVIGIRHGKSVWVNVRKGNVSDSLAEIFGDLRANDMVVKNASEEMREGLAIEPPIKSSISKK